MCCLLFLICSFLAPATAHILSSSDGESTDKLNYISNFFDPPSSRHKRFVEPSVPPNYNKVEHPPTNNSDPLPVDFSVSVNGIHSIDEPNEELSVVINLHIHWKDTRLSNFAPTDTSTANVLLNPSLLERIWHPAIYIPHLKKVYESSLLSKTATLRMFQDSTLRYASRTTITVSCPMDFYYYPADTQRCNVDLRSYSYSKKTVSLGWRDEKGAQLKDDVKLASFDVALHSEILAEKIGVRFTIVLRRKLSYYLIQVYFPSTLFVAISWISFLVPSETVPLCMCSLLTLIAMFSPTRQSIPNVSYAKALDIWMVVCMIFVSVILAQYGVIMKLRRSKFQQKSGTVAQTDSQKQSAPESNQPRQKSDPKWAMSILSASINDGDNFTIRKCRDKNPPLTLPNNPRTSSTAEKFTEESLSQYELVTNKIDIYSSVLIPTSFVIFSIIYWPWLIASSEYYSHK